MAIHHQLAGMQTPLTQEFPSLAHLSRQDIETLLAGWSPTRSQQAWYRHTDRSATASTSQIPAQEEAFESFINSLAQVTSIRRESQILLQQSEEKAHRNAKLQPALESLRSETHSLYDRATNLQLQQWPKAQREMDEEYRRFVPSTLQFNLTQSASKLHDESETLASAFAEGLPLDVASSGAFASTDQGPTVLSAGSGMATPVTGNAPTHASSATANGDADAAFVRRYRALRTTYHRRNLMADRWTRGTIIWRDD